MHLYQFVSIIINLQEELYNSSTIANMLKFIYHYHQLKLKLLKNEKPNRVFDKFFISY